MTELTRTTCPYCGVGCGVLAAPDGTIQGDPDHPANFGRLCSKGSALGETIDLEGRLLTPMVDKVPASWDTALGQVAEKFSAAIDTYGPDSVAFYVSGQLLTEDYYVANKLMKGYIGSANIDTNSRLCMASSVVGHKRAFGSDTVPQTYEDLEEADLIVLVGSNLAWCHPVLFQRIIEAKKTRPNLRIINIDPRRTATSEFSDMHLNIAPDGDIALFNGLLAHIADHEAQNNVYINAYINGYANAVATARLSNPADTGLSPVELEAFYTAWTGTEKVVTLYSQGVNQSSCGSDKVNAILNCHLATGRIGKPGCGPLSATGQPNAMGGREVGGLANMLANHLDIDNAAHRDAVQTFWNSPTISDHQGLKAVDLFDACARGEIKALWVMSTNPAVSLPDANRVAEAIANVPFVAVSDIMARTDTGDLADVLLPATGWGEKDGTVTNSERRISRQRAFLPTPGQCRPDWDIVADVARRMGFSGFDYTSPAEIFAEYIALGDAAQRFQRDLDLSVFADVDYANLMPTQWPRNGARFFAEGGFYHADGKAKMLPISAPKLSQNPQFSLNTGRNRDQWHTMTRTGKAPRLGAHLAEPYLEIHPTDAAQIDVVEGDLVAVGNTCGDGILRALITPRATPGQVFAPMHWTRQKAPSGTINSLIRPEVDPVSGQPASKTGAVELRKFAAAWYGFAASTTEMQPSEIYSAVARTRTGWQVELAGRCLPLNWEDTARRVTGCTNATAAIVTDAQTGTTAISFTQSGTLMGVFYAAPTPIALARSHVVALIGTQADPFRVLAGRPAAGQPDPGATVCGCFDVGRNTLLAAVQGGATTVAALGAQTCAGTNCGSCKPELAALLHEAALPMAAE